MQFPHNCSKCAANIITKQFFIFFLVHLVAFHPCNIAVRDEQIRGALFRCQFDLGL